MIACDSLMNPLSATGVLRVRGSAMVTSLLTLSGRRPLPYRNQSIDFPRYNITDLFFEKFLNSHSRNLNFYLKFVPSN